MRCRTYSNTPAYIDRDPHRAVRQRLEKFWQVVDLTDYNSDLSVVYALVGHLGEVTVRLSLVGPYALQLAPDGSIIQARDVSEVLFAEGFEELDQFCVLASVLAVTADVRSWRRFVMTPRLGGRRRRCFERSSEK